jgi:ribonucleoside-diphosphate reductase beta chain
MKLDHNLLPLADYHKAKKLMWDPRDIDLSSDKVEWPKQTARERDSTLILLSLFHAGEEAVTHDLTPLLMAIRRDGSHLEEEMFLTTQLFEEAKHFEFFDRWFDEVLGYELDVASRLGPSYREIFYDDLPNALNRLHTDCSRAAIAEAVVTYHMIIEGVLAETGYHSVLGSLQENQVLTGLVEGMTLIKRDEARHIAYGVYLLQRLVREEASVWDVIDARLNALLPKALGVVTEALAPFGDDVPYGLSLDELMNYAMGQYAARVNAIQRVVSNQ